MLKLQKAFTLAEVLITLVIIGVVAAITVPNVINNTNNEELVIKLKKAFSIFSQATDQIIMEEGPATEWATPRHIYELYKSKLNIAKDCGTDSGCISQGNFKLIGGSIDGANYDTASNVFKLVLSDGTQVIFNGGSKWCNGYNNGENGTIDACSFILVDVNGEKKPNTIGKDVHAFAIKENGLYPTGCDIDDLCSKNYSGFACTCKVLYDGKIYY